MEITYRNIGDLKSYENNARLHPESQIAQLCEAIKKFGFNDPIEVDAACVVISGHARLVAAGRLGYTEVPTITHSHLSKTAQRGYILAANRIAAAAEWDHGLLKTEFAALIEDGFEVGLTGFGADEIAAILQATETTEGLCDEDDAPELDSNATPKTVHGDIWLLGNHRLMCGDSTVETQVTALLNGVVPPLMVTDPPYGVDYDPAWREGIDAGYGKRATGKVKNDTLVDWSDTYSLFPGDVAYVWHAGKYTHTVAQNIQDCGFELISQIIWVKQHFALSRGDYHWQHEPCWYAVRKGAKHRWQGKRDQATTWQIKNNNSFGNSAKEETWGHGTQKPIECMARPIENNSKSGDYVYDPFGGSGTTLIACEKLGRRCLMMELDEKYCDMVIKRWQKFTGAKARLESTGEVFDG